ncbi:hypothetical protein L3Q82_021728 [Scortum barcoo]|uniref:Uncharacterized protein n=1 Tax=Scortum barcoo TaxID=214431 RepID=A0ACB8X5I7_9TELE|nr:hypothetical protein L3Q82_021728 [Scortum barcoo]
MFSASIVDGGSSKLWTQGLWCLSWRQLPRTRWWTPEVRDAVRLKKESYRTILACGTPDAVDGYQQAKQAAARMVLEAKTRVWEEFGEAMEEDYRSASKRFWQTVRRLRRGKQYSANTVYSAGGELLTSTGDIVGWWKKYFEDLLNPTDLPSNEEAEAGVSEVDSSITQAEVTEVVPSPGRSTPGYWRGELNEPIVDPRIQEEQCGFRPGRGTLDQLYTLHRVLEGLWEFAQPVHMCFVDLEKAFDRVPRGILWGLFGLCMTGAGAWFALPAVSQTCSQCMLDSGRVVPLSPDDVVLMASSGQDLQHVLERFAAECEAAGMRISTSKSEAMVLDRKRVACPLRVGGEVLPQVEEFKYLGVFFTSEGKMEREIDRRIGAASAVMRSVYRTVVVKKELSRKAKLLSIYRSIYVPTLTYGHELWVMTERTRSWIQAAEMSFLRRVAGRPPSLRDRVRSSVTLGRARSRAAAPSHREESAEVAWASVSDAPWTPP